MCWVPGLRRRFQMLLPAPWRAARGYCPRPPACDRVMVRLARSARNGQFRRRQVACPRGGTPQRVRQVSTKRRPESAFGGPPQPMTGSGTGASHSGWHTQAGGVGMSSKSALTMAALRLAMPPNAGIATLFGMHPSGTPLATEAVASMGAARYDAWPRKACVCGCLCCFLVDCC